VKHFFGSVLLAAVLFLGTPCPARPAPARQLQIVRPELHQYDGGPPLAPGFRFLTGDLVFVTFHIGGYQVSPESKVDLSYTIEAVDPEGVPVVETIHGTVATAVSPEDKDWMPIVRGSVALPSLAWGGTYRLTLAIVDKLSQQTAKTEIDIPVRGRNVEPSPALVERNFRFLRTEEDADPLLDAIYHPGDSVWARFEFTGFRYGPKNHIHVEYGVAMVDASGKALFSQPRAAVEDDDSFYPKRYLSGILSLNLDKNIAPGQYTVVLTLRDGVGNQTQESSHVFRVE
jgi:hypothetical protein